MRRDVGDVFGTWITYVYLWTVCKNSATSRGNEFLTRVHSDTIGIYL